MSDKTRLRQPTDARPSSPDDGLDYRFTLANERTFLAWFRTSLALIGGGLAVDQFLPETGGRAVVRVPIAAVLLVLGAATAVYAATRWIRTERTMRSGNDLPPSRYPGVLAGVLALGGLLLVALVLIGGDR
jgi:putative membrane protein